MEPEAIVIEPNSHHHDRPSKSELRVLYGGPPLSVNPPHGTTISLQAKSCQKRKRKRRLIDMIANHRALVLLSLAGQLLTTW